MNPVVHFEMPYDDSDRAARFYRTAFGWNMKSLGEQMGYYLLATTTATASDGRPTKPGAINGGFFAKKPDWPAQYPSVVIAVDDIQAAMAKIVRAGGEVLGEPMDIPGIGAYISFTDTEGNRVGVLQPLPMAKAAKKKAVAKKKPAAKKPAKKAVKAKKKPARKR
jgi:uncharacterized protein